jgi:hypothetical protein
MKIEQFYPNPAFFLTLILLTQTLACSGRSPRPNYYKTPDQAGPSVDQKYRLSADREAFDKMRAEIPEEKKMENDEVAFTLQLMSDYKLPPSDVREKFDHALGKKREKFQKDIQKERDDFTNTERKNREVFLKSLVDQREDFLRTRRTSEERKDFFDRQDEARKTYFETQREKRDDFESNITEKRKSFEDYAREKRNEFNDQLRSYQKKYDEIQKSKNKSETSSQNQSGEVQSFLKEFMEMDQIPSSSLESGQ